MARQPAQPAKRQQMAKRMQKKPIRQKAMSKLRNVARIRPLGQIGMRRQGVNNGINLGLLSGVRTFQYADIPDMLEDDQVALGLDYLKIPIAQAPIAVKTADPAHFEWTSDLYKRIWAALIPKYDLCLTYGENCFEPLYRKDPKNPGCWDFYDFDIAPPMSSIPWVNGDKTAFVVVHESNTLTGMSYYWFETASMPSGGTILEGAGFFRPAKALWLVNDPLTSRWFGRSVLRAAHMRWKAKNMSDGALENFIKATYRASFSGLCIRYPAQQRIFFEDGSSKTSEEYADFICMTVKSGSNIRLPAMVEGQPGWAIEEYAKERVDLDKVRVPLDYLDKGIMRGMGIPDEVATHEGSTGGYSRSLVSIDAFYSRGENRASTILPSITSDIVLPLGRQRFGRAYDVKAHIMRAQRPDDDNKQDANGNGIPDALEGAMGADQQPDGSDQQTEGQQPPPGNGKPPNGKKTFPMSVSKKDRASSDALIAAGVAVKARDTGRVLMLQRAMTMDDPAAGTWEFPGGHIDGDESPFETAMREWQEETGNEFPKGRRTGKWMSSDGVYAGFVWAIPSESAVNLHQGENRAVINPDDPDGDNIEVVAWFDPAMLKDNPAVRAELHESMDSVVKAIK